jgi:lipopolysaccharide transport system ATP-binding protein
MAAIEVSHLTKEYRLGALQSMKQSALNAGARLLGRPVAERPMFKALDDVSFSIEPGEVVGIIGHNGAGKSTLLKLLARISTPTSGSVKVSGRIAPLIEVGAGFVPDFTGRENVYLNASILGMAKKEIDRKFDEIVDFAEMAEFIDTPVKRYSSGMQVKLAFAVATSIESDILIVDEVLAVGDLAFQRKCFDRTEDLIKRQGRTVLLVSHNIRQVERICKRVVLLDHGHLIADDSPKLVCDQFYAQSQLKISDQINKSRISRGRYESTGDIELVSMVIRDSENRELTEIHPGGNFTLQIRLNCRVPISRVAIGVGLHTTDFVYLTTHNSEISKRQIDLSPGEHEFRFSVIHFPLLPGVYMWRVGISSGETGKAIFYADNILATQVNPATGVALPASMREGYFLLDGTWNIKSVGGAGDDTSEIVSIAKEQLL